MEEPELRGDVREEGKAGSRERECKIRHDTLKRAIATIITTGTGTKEHMELRNRGHRGH